MEAVTMQTQVARDAVHYAVLVDGDAVWRKAVTFGKTARTRAGGHAFVEAAHEQERVATKQVEQLRRE